MKDLRLILEEAAALAPEVPQIGRPSQRFLARLSGIDPSRLSRLLDGREKLGSAAAAKVLRTIQDAVPLTAEMREKLQRDLAAYVAWSAKESGSPTHSRYSIENARLLFERVGRSALEHVSEGRAPLICCEYRDIPRGNAYPAVTQALAEAVARGAHFAMFQPFGNSSTHQHGPSHEAFTWAFYHTLKGEVRQVFRLLRTEAVAAAQRLGLEQNAADIEARIVLYERSGNLQLGSGFQSRVFLVEYVDTARRTEEKEVWEWVASRGKAGEHDDLFVHRDDRSLPERVVRGQFFPVTNHWAGSRPRRSLPQNWDEIEQAVRNSSADESNAGMTQPWDTFPSTKPSTTTRRGGAGTPRTKERCDAPKQRSLRT